MTTEERKVFWDTLCSVNEENLEFDIKKLTEKIQYPRFLYRFRHISVSTIDALQTNRLYFSKANGYDDPFDTLIKIDFRLLNKYASKFFSRDDLFEKMDIFCKTLAIPEAIRMNAENILKSTSIENIINGINTYLKANIRPLLQQSLWSVCFSESGTNENMWLKYADQYNGFCVMYDLENEGKRLCGKQEKCKNCVVNTSGVSLYPMYYSDARYDATEYARSLTIACIAQSFLPLNIANLIIQSLPNAAWEQEKITLIKSKCHEYDGEWRMLLRSNSQGPVMQEWIPHGVILGLRTTERDRELIIRSAKLAGIECFYQLMIDDGNELDIKEI